MKGIAAANIMPDSTDHPSKVLRMPYLFSVIDVTGEIIAAARLLAPKLLIVRHTQLGLFAFLQSGTYKSPLARPRRSTNQSSINPKHGANISPLPIPNKTP